jgi:hypothetical protein
MRIYLSGPMRGLPDLNRKAFTEAAMVLGYGGHEVWDPTDEDQEGTQTSTFDYCIRRDVRLIMEKCNAMVVLPGWSKSQGATLEVLLALALNYPVYLLDTVGDLHQLNLLKTTYDSIQVHAVDEIGYL